MEITDDEIREILEYCEGDAAKVTALSEGLARTFHPKAATNDLIVNEINISRMLRDLPRLATALREARERVAELEAQRDSLQMQVESETYSKCFTDTNVGDD